MRFTKLFYSVLLMMLCSIELHSSNTVSLFISESSPMIGKRTSVRLEISKLDGFTYVFKGFDLSQESELIRSISKTSNSHTVTYSNEISFFEAGKITIPPQTVVATEVSSGRILLIKSNSIIVDVRAPNVDTSSAPRGIFGKVVVSQNESYLDYYIIGIIGFLVSTVLIFFILKKIQPKQKKVQRLNYIGSIQKLIFRAEKSSDSSVLYKDLYDIIYTFLRNELELDNQAIVFSITEDVLKLGLNPNDTETLVKILNVSNTVKFGKITKSNDEFIHNCRDALRIVETISERRLK